MVVRVKRRAVSETPRVARVWAYTRVSTVQQESGESLDVQQRMIGHYAAMHRLPVSHVFIEKGVSGAKPLSQREQGAKLLAALKPGDIIIASKLDRMFRSALDALDVANKLLKVGVSLHLIDLGGDVMGNGMAKAFFTIASAFAEAERDRIRERITEVKRDQRQRGRYLGGRVPYGYRVVADGQLIEVPDQQKAIRRMLRLRANGHSYRTISERLGSVLTGAGTRKVLLAAQRSGHRHQ
jgi:DNA invertase Pin-like site-specific DNA recombinase